MHVHYSIDVIDDYRCNVSLPCSIFNQLVTIIRCMWMSTLESMVEMLLRVIQCDSMHAVTYIKDRLVYFYGL